MSLVIQEQPNTSVLKSTSWAETSITNVKEIKEAVEFEQALENLKKMSGLDFHGDDLKARMVFAKLYEETFSKSLTTNMNRINGATPYARPVPSTYTDLFEDLNAALDAGFHIDLSGISLRWRGVVEFDLRAIKDTAKVSMKLVVYIKEGKIVELKQVNFSALTRVSGQVPADPHAVKIPFAASEKELSRVVFPLPQQVKNKLLATEKSDMLPAQEAGTVIKLYLKHHQDLLHRNGSIDILDSEGLPYADGAKFVERKRMMHSRRLILQDGTGKALALCVDSTDGPIRSYTVFGTKPLGEKNHVIPGTVEVEGGKNFYPWFRIIDDHPSFVSIDVWDSKADRFKSMLRATPKSYGFAIASACKNHNLGNIVSTLKSNGNIGWNVICAPGVDPAMMLCIAASLENMVEVKFASNILRHLLD